MICHIQNGQNGRTWGNFEPLAEAVDIRNAQLALVVRHLPVALAGNVIVALLTAGILSAIVSLSQVAVWSGLLIALTSVRTLLLRRHSARSAELDSPDRTILGLAVASGFSGCLWGGGLVLLLPEPPLYHLFVAFVLGGMAAGAVVTLAPVWPVLLAFLLPCVLPFAVRLALTGTSIYIGMAALIVMFVAALLMAAWYLNRWIGHTLRLQSENARLIRQLTGVLADLEQRTADLTTACDEANWANQAKTRFVAAASHDLGQPFQAMRLFLDLLERRLADPADRELLHHLNDAHQAGERMLGSLLDLSRLQTGTVEPRIEAFPMADLLDRLETDFRSLAANQGLTLRVRRCNAVVRSDPVLLQRIIANLLANAVRYTRHGGILLGCRRRDQTLRIEVWDTGVGIPADHQDEIFEEFRQLDGAPEAGAPGVGLGLAIVRETAHLLHHPIQICSVPNRGSVFSVAFPLDD